MLLNATQISKSIGTRLLFSGDHLEVHEGDRIGLVGVNGAGKSTLLSILADETTADSGLIERFSASAIIHQNGTSEEGMISAKWRKRLNLKNEINKSGGQQTRLAIAAALSQETPLLLADEPTTNLDLEGILLLEEILQTYNGAVVLISHDRRLLDSVCTTIWAIENGNIRCFNGNYSAYLAQKTLEWRHACDEYRHYTTEKQRLTTAIRQTKQHAQKIARPKHLSASEIRLPGMKGVYGSKARAVDKRANALEKRLEQLAVKEKPQNPPQITFILGNQSPIVSKNALSIEGLSVAYHNNIIINNASFVIPASQCTVIMGNNGAGKSTLIKVLLTEQDAVKKANGLKIGYFDQNHEQLDKTQTALANIRAKSTMPEHQIRTVMANLYLKEADIFKTVDQLSGGERAKVAFAQLLCGDYNCLILDEPTNHLDSYTTEALEILLQKWRGTLLIVTHDRQLCDKIAQQLLMVKNGIVTAFHGNWSQYESTLQPIPAEESAQQLDLLTIDMHMAQLCSQMNEPNSDMAALDKAWQELLALKRQLLSGTTNMPDAYK